MEYQYQTINLRNYHTIRLIDIELKTQTSRLLDIGSETQTIRLSDIGLRAQTPIGYQISD
jgi:hypothetical protein